jgi:hypothetical protein
VIVHATQMIHTKLHANVAGVYIFLFNLLCQKLHSSVSQFNLASQQVLSSSCHTALHIMCACVCVYECVLNAK